MDIIQRAPRACVRTTSALRLDRAVLEADGQSQPGARLGRGAEALELRPRSPASLRSIVSPLSSKLPYSASTGTTTRPRTALRRWLSRPGR